MKVENQSVILCVENYVEVTGIYQEVGRKMEVLEYLGQSWGSFVQKVLLKSKILEIGVKKLVGKVKIIKLILFTIFIFFVDTFAPHFYMTLPSKPNNFSNFRNSNFELF